ncbi:MAG: phosphoglycolate phosphatase [Ancylobacter novellus]|uniref:Phosphoglycolate phosphatase n=1 Tax=Ancylobacter novellus TaxID=921 RepID=A0A2W5MB49_ANCNO|nr:MAG: phosphoglycolate phosphatase [Ancylobacter novellus]
MSETPPLTVVFDLDGTLVETAPDLIAALTVALAADGAPPLPYEQGRDLIGAGARALVERGLEAAGRSLDTARVDELHAIFLDHYGAHIADGSHPYPGCVAALDRLAAGGAKLAVCTNKIESLARQLLDALALTEKFDAIVGGDTFATSKPSAEPLLGAIERAGGDASRAVMVGDSSTDVGAAKAAGVPVVVMSFGYTVTPPSELGGDVVIDHFGELDRAIASLTVNA